MKLALLLPLLTMVFETSHAKDAVVHVRGDGGRLRDLQEELSMSISMSMSMLGDLSLARVELASPKVSPASKSSKKAPPTGKSTKFEYGVASGDPLATAIILWTHARPSSKHPTAPVRLAWEMSTDEDFESIAVSGKVIADASTGYTAKVDATGLSAGTEYWYRFKRGKSYSPVGLTRTLPEADVSEVKLAVFSCANYGAGYFHAYKDAVDRGAQYALHLGDYIYESKSDGYGQQQA